MSGYKPPPPEDLAEAAESVLPPPREDTHPEGMSDPGVPPAPLKLPEPMVPKKERPPDELVPAFTQITRVGLGDMPGLQWVIERLDARFPSTPNYWHALLHSCLNNDQFFFRRGERAVALATMFNEPFGPRHVRVYFVFHQDVGPQGGSIRNSQGEKEALALVRAMRDWGQRQGAVEIKYLNHCSDVPAHIWVKELKAERYEEVFLPINR